jgi:hypothetical protein
MHIHVGISNNGRFPIQALRTLGFLCLIFEHEISRLYEAHRTQTSNLSFIRSNLKEYRSTNADFHDREYQYDEGGTIIARSKYISIAKLRELILDNVTAGDVAYHTLKQQVSSEKNYLVNFQNIDGKNGRTSRIRPPTVEFRQPEATFDHITVGHLVHFYTSLVALALRLSYGRSGAPVLPRITRWDSNINFRDLLDLLVLPVWTRNFLVKRLTEHPSAAPDRNTYWEDCNADGKRDDDGPPSPKDDGNGPRAGDDEIAHESYSEDEPEDDSNDEPEASSDEEVPPIERTE